MSSHHYQTTHWSLVAQAAATEPEVARPALAELFQQYQRPLIAVARMKGLSPEDSADAVQEFFCDILEDNWLQNANQDRGRFRAFLAVSWKRFLVDHYRKQSALKRVDKENLEQLAHSLFLSTTAVKVALHRLRSKFAEMLRCKVAETVTDPAEIDAELDIILKAYPTKD